MLGQARVCNFFWGYEYGIFLKTPLCFKGFLPCIRYASKGLLPGDVTAAFPAVTVLLIVVIKVEGYEKGTFYHCALIFTFSGSLIKVPKLLHLLFP